MSQVPGPKMSRQVPVPEVPRPQVPRPQVRGPRAPAGTDRSGFKVDFPDEPSIAVLLHQVPEFEPVYLDLVSTFDDAPGEAVVFTELADFVASRLTAVETDRPVLERALGAIEIVAEGEDIESAELIGYAFLDSLSPLDRDRIRPWLGPRTRSLLEELDDDSGAEGLLRDDPRPR